MYRHLAESIKENNDKQFISQAELNTLKSYENTLRKKEDTYTKQELEDFIKEFDNVVETVQGSHITIEESRNAMIDNIEIYGKTVQNPTDLSDIKSVGNKLSDGRYGIPIVCTGKNMFNGNYQQGYYETGKFISVTYPSRSTYPIKVKPNTNYTKTETNRSSWHFYRADGSYILNIIDNNPTTITTPDEAEYMIVYYHNGNPTTNLPVIGNLEEFMIVEGDTLPTTYEPYVEYRTEMILPCNLEKIGNISDRLFINNKGKWCIEKNIKTITIDESYIFKRREDLDSEFTERYTIDIPDNDIIHIRNLPSNVFSTKVECVIDPDNLDNPWYNTDNMINIYGHNVGDEVHVKRLKSDSSLFTDLESFKKFMNDSTLKYVTECPIIIPLTDNQQVKLKSFKGVTHIYFDCEISGEIKCDVNKTKKSIVNSITNEFKNISDELEDIEKMEKGLLTTVKSENYLVDIEKTNNGYISDICIEGKTLVNILPERNKIAIGGSHTDKILPDNNGVFKGVSLNKNYFYVDGNTFWYGLKPNKTYTVKGYILLDLPLNSEDQVKLFYRSGTVQGETHIIEYYKLSSNNDTVNIDISFTTNVDCNGQFGFYTFTDGPTIGVECRLMVLEGDHTDKSLPYFEGLKSVGDGIDNISIESINKNIFEDNVINQTGRGVNGNGLIYPEMFDNVRNRCRSANLIKVKPNTNYYLSSKGKFCLAVAEFDIDNKQILDNSWTIPVTGGVYRTSARCKSIIVAIRKDDNSEITPSEVYGNIQIEEGSDKTEYIPHKSDKKQLMYYDNKYEEWLKPILRSLPNGIKDTIEKHNDGKYYYHKRCGEILFDGTENWIHPSQDSDSTTLFYSFISDAKINQNHPICDKFNGTYINMWDTTTDIEGILINHNKDCLLRIKKSKLSTQDVQGFKSWLQSDNVTVVYELSQEEIYECSPIDLQTFEDTTTMIIESGPICPKTNVSVVSNIGATLHVVKEKISNLETQMASNNTFDSIVLLQSLYSSDVASLQFNISVCNESRISNDSTIYDNDIYVLIKDILVNGKDLINLEYLETVIDFYTMVNKISYEMADELFDLLYTDDSYIEE